MGKKLNALVKGDGEGGDEKLADAVLASAQQIWQAGLGAFAVAEKEGGKLFSKLVKDGIAMQNRTRSLAEIKVSGVADSMNKMAGNINKQASGSWDKIEQVFEDRVTRTLATLGVPTSQDIHSLARQVEDLSKAVSLLSATQSSTHRGGIKPTVKKPASRRTSAMAAEKTAVMKAAIKPGTLGRLPAKTSIKKEKPDGEQTKH